MTRRELQRLNDILDSIEIIRSYTDQGGVVNGIVYDACRVRLIEIGESVKHLSPELLANAPATPWREIARLRDRLVHHYFDTDFANVQRLIDEDLEPLQHAVRSLILLVTSSTSEGQS
jgi:uncharacterized protein with HEPN domain